MTELVFLGCGGGRYQTLHQNFGTGGFRIHDRINLHIDPGPGALLLTHEVGLSPFDIDCVIVTHSHTDHYGDAEVLVEAMARRESGGPGRLVGSKSVLHGEGKLGPAISNFHQNKAGRTVCLASNETHNLGGVKIEATSTIHSDPTAFGLKIFAHSGLIGYTGDTQYFGELPSIFEDSRVLVLNVTRPGNKRIQGHLCSNDVAKILEIVKPELAVIIHMGMLFLKSSPEKEAKNIEKKSDVRTVPGHLGTQVKLNEEVEISLPTKQPKLESFV